MPGTLNLLIARRFATTLAIILFAVAVIIFLASYVEVLRRFSDEAGFSTLMGVRLALMRIPILLDTALPFAFLFAAIVSLLGLSRKLELVVARAAGVSVWGFLSAPFAVALIVGALATALLNPVAVGMRDAADIMEGELSGASRRGEAGHWFRQESETGQSIVRAAATRGDGMALYGVTVFVFDRSGKFLEKATAPRADYSDGRWVLSPAGVVSASRAPETLGRYELPTTLTPEELRRSVVLPDAISVWSLPAFIETARRTGIDSDRFRVAFHSLLNRPLFLLAMVMIAATVSLRLTRYGGTWRLVLTGVAGGFLLYVLTEVIGDLGGNGIINPVLAAWLPPIVALTFGATVLLHQEDG